MTSYALSQVRNFRRCGAGVPRALEVEAVIEEITAGWDLQAVCATAVKGVADADCEDIREMIRAEGLTLSPEEAARALHAWCRTRVRDLIEEAETQVRLDEVVSAYLEALGEADRARGESYEETAARLDDPIMRAAAKRWWELEEAAAAEAAAEVVIGHNTARIDPSFGGRILVSGPDAQTITGIPQDTLEKDLQRQLRAEIKARFIAGGIPPLDIPVKWESE